MFRSAKDYMAGKAAQVYVNNLISRYATLLELRIDSREKSAEIVVQPKGESAGIRVRIDEYEVLERDGMRFVRLKACTCSRAWVQNLVNDFALNREVEIPPWAMAAL